MIFLKRWFAYNKTTQGDMHEYQEEAIENYQKFLDLWRDADPGIEEVRMQRKGWFR